MNNSEPQGCLAAILRLFGIEIGGQAQSPANTALPYRLRDDFLSPAELSFYRVVLNVIGERTVVLAKVNLADIFFVAQREGKQSYRNKIDRKHVDFLICNLNTLSPVCGIELDDKSHERLDRQERDQFVDQVFGVAGLPLVRIRAQASYSPTELASQIEAAIGGETPPPPPSPNENSICPKCNVPFVERVAKKGPNAGKTFLGCPNYPKCRETVPAK